MTSQKSDETCEDLTWDGKVAKVMQLVLQNTQDNSDRTVCTLLQTNSSCRQAVVQCRAVCSVQLDVDWHLLKPEQQHPTLRSFVSWIARHSTLVSSLTINNMDGGCAAEALSLQGTIAAALQQHHAAAVQAAAGQGAGAGAATAAAAAAEGKGCATPLLHLTALHLASGVHLPLLAFVDPSTLQALDGFSLEEDLQVLPSLAHLTALHSVDLQTQEGFPERYMLLYPVHSPKFLCSLQHLQKLTKLCLSCDVCMITPADVQYLPPSLVHLEAGFQHTEQQNALSAQAAPVLFDMTHLACLRELHWNPNPCVVWDEQQDFEQLERNVLEADLPQALTSLLVGSPLPRVLQGANLQQLVVDMVAPPDVPRLRSLLETTRPQAVTIKFGFGVVDCPHHFRGVLAALLAPADAQEIVAAVGSTNSVTSLSIDLSHYLYKYEDAGLECCRPLVGLTGLELLSLKLTPWSPFARPEQFVSLQPHDVRHLSVLTALEHLQVFCGEGIDDASAVVLALQLRHLTRLSLKSSSMSSPAILPAVGTLTNLRTLQLAGGALLPACDADLLLFSGLTKLSTLFWNHNCTAEGIKCLQASVAGVTSIDAYFMMFD